jgi:16S rRNA (adenine1518-N6/adenine1519-N6)-dimethyltransferase
MEEEFINDTNYLDQHFLIDKGAINKFVDAVSPNINDDIVEIGPGKGVISEYLARRANHLTVIEIDRKLEHFISVLEDKFDNVDVLYGNALNVFIPDCTKIVSALPYSITEPFVEKLLRCNFEEAILIVGSHYANAVLDKKIEKLPLLTNSFFHVEKIDELTPDVFEPAPRVMSSIIKLTPMRRSELSNNFKMFVFREMFFKRDRKLKNNLMEALIEFAKFHGEKLTKKESKKIVEEYNLEKDLLNKRMENLSNEDFKIIYDILK